MLLHQLHENELIPSNVLQLKLGEAAAHATIKMHQKGRSARWVGFDLFGTEVTVWFDVYKGSRSGVSVKSFFEAELHAMQLPLPSNLWKTVSEDADATFNFVFGQIDSSKFNPALFKKGWNSVKGSSGFTMSAG